MFELLQEVPNMVDNLIASNKWPYKQLGKKTFTNYLPKDSKVPKKDKKKDQGDITTFVSQLTNSISKLTNSSLQANAANLDSNQKRKADTPTDKPNGTYKYCSDRWGAKKHFKNEAQFKSFYDGSSICDKTKTYLLDGDKWKWCEKCKRMGNHLTAEHRDKKKHKGNNKANKASIQLPPVEGNHSQIDVTANLAINGSGTYSADSNDAHNIEDLLTNPSN
jgi:hypothetical protein